MQGMPPGAGRRRKKKGVKQFDPLRKHTGIVNRLVTFVATGFYAGYAPGFPGTAGCLLGYLLWRFTWGRIGVSPFVCFLVLLGAYLMGVAVETYALELFSEGERDVLVLDRVLGIVIAFSYLDPTKYQNDTGIAAVTFALFWFLTLLTPFPLSKLKELPAGFGVMTPSAAAGVMVLLIMGLPFEVFWVPLFQLREVVHNPFLL